MSLSSLCTISTVVRRRFTISLWLFIHPFLLYGKQFIQNKRG